MDRKAARIRSGTVIAVDLALQHAQECHLLSAMMRCVRDAPHHDPCAAARNTEERHFLLPPRVVTTPESRKTRASGFGITLNECDARLVGRKGRHAKINAEHILEPCVLAHALMHHVFSDAAATLVCRMRTNG